MDYRELGNSGLTVSVIGLGTWVMGGWMWGGADERESVAAIRRALELGITLIDTAPIYGHGRAEEVVGRAVAEAGARDRVILATKVGLQWNPEQTRVWRDSSRRRIFQEVEDSLRRLRTDRIDLYQIHWPDTTTPFGESMEALLDLKRTGTIRAIGLSNFNTDQMAQCLKVGPVDVLQPPYNLFERGIEARILPFCREHHLGTLIYSPLCRGLLSGKYTGTETFPEGDVRANDPKFHGKDFRAHVAAVERLRQVATRRHVSVGALAIRWCLDQPGVTVALCGARRPDQVDDNVRAAGWALTATERQDIARLVEEMIPAPLGPEFMAPP